VNAHYLAEKIGALLGKPEAVVIIHGGMGREVARRPKRFLQDKEVEVLVAPTAAARASICSVPT